MVVGRVQLTSFSFKYGVPSGVDLVVDARSLPDPSACPELNLMNLNGTDALVCAFFMAPMRNSAFQHFFIALCDVLSQQVPCLDKEEVHLAFGCTGGRHRSVFVLERVSRWLRECYGVETTVEHRDAHSSCSFEGSECKSKALTQQTAALPIYSLEAVVGHLPWLLKPVSDEDRGLPAVSLCLSSALSRRRSLMARRANKQCAQPV